MAFWNWFAKKTVAPVVVDDEKETEKATKKASYQYKASLDKRRYELDMELLEAQKGAEIAKAREEKAIAEYNASVAEIELEELDGGDEDDDDSPDNLFSQFIQTLNQAQQQKTAGVPVPTAHAPVQDKRAQFKAHWDSLPETVRTLARKMDDDSIKRELMSQQPSLTADDLKIAIEVVRNG